MVATGAAIDSAGEEKLGDFVSPRFESVGAIGGGDHDGVIDDPEDVGISSPEVLPPAV